MNSHQKGLPHIHNLMQDKMHMKYVRVYKSMDTGWTTFDTMSERGFRVFIHLTPGELAKSAGEDFLKNASVRRLDYEKYESDYQMIRRAMELSTTNSYGYFVPETVDPYHIKSKWGLAMFMARYPMIDIPICHYSMEEIEIGLQQAFDTVND